MCKANENEALDVIHELNNLNNELATCLRRQDSETIDEDAWKWLITYESELRRNIKRFERKLNLLNK